MTTATTETLDRTGIWAIDASHSSLEFTVRHAMVTKVRGRFTDFEGTLTLDEADPTQSRAEVVVQMSSVDTGSADRDSHLRTSDFFEVESYPTMTFSSTSAAVAGADRFTLAGDLTLHGVTKPVTFDGEVSGTAVDPFGNTRIGFEGATTISRKEWGLSWNAPLEATAGVLVSDKVTISIDVSAIRQ